MRRKISVWRRLAVAVGVVLSVCAAGVEAAFRPAPASTAIPCRVLESHTSQRDHITVVVFHQRDAGDRARLGEVIRQRDGAAVAFKMTDPNPHSAMLFRLKSCFGRGLLLFPAASARLAAGDEFELDVSAP